MRLIDADALYTFIQDQMEKETGAYTRGQNKAFNIVKSALHNECAIPTIDPVVHGEWITLDECSNAGVYCSKCKKKVYKENYANVNPKSNYCPNCGAKMDGGKE